MPLLSTLAALFFLEETLPRDRRRALFSFTKGREINGQTIQPDNEVLPLRGLFTKPVCYMLFMWSFYTVRM